MSGAKNCPETPRQKMIGMMYLVLTAMLALNVSSSILEGFSMVDNSLHTSLESAKFRNNAQYQDFKSLCDKNPKKVKEWLDKANQVKSKSDELYFYIEKFKLDIIKLADVKEANDSAYVKQIKNKDNLDKAGEYGLLKGNGKILKQKINDYTNFLVQLSEGNQAKINMYKSVFSTAKSRDGKSWEYSMFEMMPVAAVVTILTKYQSDVRAAEGEIVQYLKSQTDASDFRVNKLDAYVIPDSKYIIKGDRYKAQIVLSAVDSTQNPTYTVNGSTISNGKYEAACTTVGPKKFSGTISFKGNDGQPKFRPFSGDYMVGEPTATLSNEDLNVVYKGIDNKFSVSVPGVAAANISIAVEGGSSVQNGPGRYIIRTTHDGEIKINVFAKIDKQNIRMGGGIYRTKNLPDPTAYLQPSDANGKLVKGGYMSLSSAKSCKLIASYGNDELIKANFTITSFTMIARGSAPLNVNGSRLTGSFLDRLAKGEILILSNIKAIGPDQVTRDLGSMFIQL